MNTIIYFAGYVLFFALIVIIILKFKNEEENYYPVKIIGYTILGAFRFTFNHLHIPLGFLIFLFAFRPNKNNLGKRLAACLGLLILITSLAVPAANEAYFRRTRYVQPVSENIYNFDFKKQWDRVADVLGMDETTKVSAKLEDLKVSCSVSGTIELYDYQVVWMDKGKLYHSFVYYLDEYEKINVRVSRLERWDQYDRLATVEKVFDLVNGTAIISLFPKGKFTKYNLWCPGDYTGFDIKDGEKYIINENGILPYMGRMPVNCCFMRNSSEGRLGNSGGSPNSLSYYLIDIGEEK